MSANLHQVARLHRLSVADYHHMGAAGILGPDLRTELIEGEIIEMTPIGSNHGGTVNLLSRLLAKVVGDVAIVAVQNPVRLDDFSEPQPDLALLRPNPDFYRTAHPGPREVLLVIEVSDSSLRYDRDLKFPLYARAGIAEAWLVDLDGRALSRHTDPAPNGYQTVERVSDLTNVVLSPMDCGIDLTGLF